MPDAMMYISNIILTFVEAEAMSWVKKIFARTIQTTDICIRCECNNEIFSTSRLLARSSSTGSNQLSWRSQLPTTRSQQYDSFSTISTEYYIQGTATLRNPAVLVKHHEPKRCLHSQSTPLGVHKIYTDSKILETRVRWACGSSHGGLNFP
jgi:hypothetical protein